jgi:hypothetical protein
MAVTTNTKLICKLNDSSTLLREYLIENEWEIFDEETMNEEDWNLNWKGARFKTSEYNQCKSFQRMNHFPATGLVTRKESLARLMRTMKCIYGKLFNFSPLSFCVYLCLETKRLVLTNTRNFFDIIRMKWTEIFV